MKLPPHCTDLLQPLDVACFSSLKTHYDTALTEYISQRSAHESLKKTAFVDILSSVWDKGLKDQNIKSGFRKTGIYPFNPKEYNVDRLDKIKLKTYETWIEAGRPLDDEGIADTRGMGRDSEFNPDAHSTPLSSQEPLPSTSTGLGAVNISTMQEQSPGNQSGVGININIAAQLSLQQLIAEINRRAEQTHYANISWHKVVTTGTSIEEVLQARGRSASSPPMKRRKITNKAILVTSDSALIEKKSKAADKLSKINKTKQKTAPTTKKTKKTKAPIEEDLDSTSSVSSVDMDLRSSSNGSLNLGNSPDLTTLSQPSCSPPQDKKQQQIILDDECLNKFVVVYYEEPRLTYYWGKVHKIFRDEQEGEIIKLELEFLKRKTLGSDPGGWSWCFWTGKDKDIAIVQNLKYVFFGPVVPDKKHDIFYFDDVKVNAFFIENIKTE